MPIFPFFQYPYNMNRYYQQHNNYAQNNSFDNSNSFKHDNTNLPNNIENNINKDTNNSNYMTNNNYNNEKKSSRYSGFGSIHFQNPFSLDSDEPILEILGISLYLDDIIILGLLFFLYNEGVKDYMLYLALIMLLLS